MNTYAKIRKAMRDKEREVLQYLRDNEGELPIIRSIAWSRAFGRLEDAGMLRYDRTWPLGSTRFIPKRNARPVTK